MPLPLLITGIPGVPGYNALHYFQAKYPGQVFGIRQADNSRLDGPAILACSAEDREVMARLFDRCRFASVLDCAGNCALKACELSPELARRINVDGVANLLSQTVPRRRPPGPPLGRSGLFGRRATADTSRTTPPTR